MRIYLPQTVLEASLDRIRRLYREFPHIYIATSGGKDSTVCLQLALTVAAEMDRLPVRVLFVDQEAEWQSAIDYIREVMHRPTVQPYWLQVPIKISNSASIDDVWLYCWQEGVEWMRPKEPDSIHVNTYGTDRFKLMFEAFLNTMHPGEKACVIGGVRAEESPSRHRSLVMKPKYQDITWAKQPNKAQAHFSFYPIYDWTTSDVWKYIHESGAPYCPIYDHMYQRGVPVNKMRVSNLHHETAIHALFWLQEIEGKTWDALTRRLGGIHSARNMTYSEMFQVPKELPFMFRSWREYRDHLLENLIVIPEHREMYREAFARYDANYEGMIPSAMERLTKVQITTILTNDFHLTKLDNFASMSQAKMVRQWKTGRPIIATFADWIPAHARQG